MMILVGAARGRIGKRTIDRLATKLPSKDFIAGVRDVSNLQDFQDREIKAREVDYGNPDGMSKAFQGCERVVLIPSFADTETRAQQCKNVISAAQEAGVKQVVFVGLLDTREDSPIPFAKAYGQIEEALHASSLDFTILRTSMYTDNLAEQYPMWLKNGELVTCAGDGKISYISRDDIVSCIVGVLLSPVSSHARKTYKITGPEALDYQEVAKIISAKFGQPIKISNVERDEFAARLQKVWGVAYKEYEHVARVTPLFQTAFKQGVMSPVTNDVEFLTGKPAETVINWLERH